MGKFIEKRRCRRFEIPGAQVRYKKIRLGISFKDFSEYRALENISKGGLVFWCEEKLKIGGKISVQLLTPSESPLELIGRVHWQGFPADKMITVVGIEFMPFGKGRMANPREALDVLVRLEQRYGGQRFQGCESPMRKIANLSKY